MFLSLQRYRGDTRGYNVPEGALAQFAQNLVVADLGATREAGFRSLVSNGKGAWRGAIAGIARIDDAHGRRAVVGTRS